MNPVCLRRERAEGGIVLDATVARWTGDLRKFSAYAWVEEDTDVVAIAVAKGGHGKVWINLFHARDEDMRLIWYWGRSAAAYDGPVAVLTTRDLLILHPEPA